MSGRGGDWSRGSSSAHAFSSGGAQARSSLLGGRQLAREASPERDIEAELDTMHDSVQRLKRVVGAIDEESKHRNALLEELESTVFKAQAAVKETVRKINKKYKEGGGSNYMVFVFLFALGMLLLCYALLKFRRVVRWFLRFL